MTSHSMDGSFSVWSNGSSSSSSASTSTSSDNPVVVRHTPGSLHGVIGSGRRTGFDEGIHIVDELNSSSSGCGAGKSERIHAQMQLELDIARRKLRATELAYKQLENDYLSIRDSHSTVLVVLSGSDDYSGEERVQHVLQAVRADLEEQQLQARIQVIYSSRAAKGSSGTDDLDDVLTVQAGEQGEKLQHLVGTLSPFSQVKRVYVSLSPTTASCILVPILQDIIEGRNTSYSHSPASLECSPKLGYPGWTSPTSTDTSDSIGAHGRKQSESASDCSTAATSVYNGHAYAKTTRHQEGAHAMLDKIRLLSAGDDDENVLAGVVKELKSLYLGKNEMIAQLEEMAIGSLFGRVEMPIPASEPRSKSQEQATVNSASHSADHSNLVAGVEFDAPALIPLKTVSLLRANARTSKDKIVSNAKLQVATASSANAKTAASTSAKKSSLAITPVNSPITPAKSLPSPVPTVISGIDAGSVTGFSSAAVTPEMGAGGWADIVRKGKKVTSLDGAAGSTSSPSTPVLGSSKPAGGDEHDNSKNAKVDLGSVLSLKPRNGGKWTPLDPNLPLCKQRIPPCNMYYIGFGCSNPKCNYGHDYKLNAAQREELRLGALKTVCTYKRAKQACITGKDCVFGHVCPQGKKCKLGSKCQFPPHMHTA